LKFISKSAGRRDRPILFYQPRVMGVEPMTNPLLFPAASVIVTVGSNVPAA
jgi:hypothetical protein